MKHLSTFLLGALLSTTLTAQYCIVRQNNGESSFYYHDANTAFSVLQQAISEANTGDTLHLPGATYSISSEFSIDKRLVIVGTGIDPDSTATTQGTIWSTDGFGIRVLNTADGLEFHGLSMVSGGAAPFLYFGTSLATSDVSDVKFIRCTIGVQVVMQGAGSGNSLATNTLFDGCVILSTIQVRKAVFTTIRNSILKGDDLFDAGTGCVVENCVILDIQPGTSNSNQDVNYRNCIFLRNAGTAFAPVEQSDFENNLWILQPGGTLNLSGVASASGNLSTTLIDEVFLPNLPAYNIFSWAYNYHLVPGSAYETMGIGGTQVGVYGGAPLAAWKDGALPFNPHWESLDVPSATTTNGVLEGLHIRGTAQSH